MAVHIFCVNERNYEICVQRGLVGIPEPKPGSRYSNTFDGLLSRLTGIREDDRVLMYITGTKELRGLWKAEGRAFYDKAPVWHGDNLYPFRCKIKCAEYSFSRAIPLHDINDLRNTGKLWTWALQRPSGSNVMFSITDQEFEVLLQEYMKINPFTLRRSVIREPYPFHEPNLLEYVHKKDGMPEFEYSIMALLNHAFATKDFGEIFGNYSDHLCYVPTNLSQEMDILLAFENPGQPGQILSYDIIEVKRGKFNEKALAQLIDYESWFIQKKVSGDLNMVRTTAIARSFAGSVVDYVNKRTRIEKKPVKLLEYGYDESQGLLLNRL